MPTQFIITCAARTGSTMLRHLLNSHPEILCHGEVYRRKGWKRFFQKDQFTIHTSNTDAALIEKFKQYPTDTFIQEHLLRRSEESQKAVGFKFKTDEYFDQAFAPIAKSLHRNKRIKVIHLRRKDLVAQYISHLLVLNHKTPTVVFKKQRDQKINKIKINKKELLGFCHDVVRRETSILEEMSLHDSIHIWYEEIVNEPSKLSAVQEFLKVQPQELKTITKKIINEYRDLILNIDDVRLWMNDSIFESRTIFNKH